MCIAKASPVPPIIDPVPWEDYPVFRETFLLYITDPACNATLRIFGRLLHELALEYYRHRPNWLEGVTATELRAAAADLRPDPQKAGRSRLFGSSFRAGPD